MQKRNYSLNLLRMVAMFLVATLHTLGLMDCWKRQFHTPEITTWPRQ